MPIKVLICGDRKYINKELIEQFIISLPDDSVIIEGEAKGADSIARDIALQHGLKVEKYPANWETYGKAAGPIRNAQMLKEGNPDIVVGYHDDIYNSKGTLNMLKIAKKANKPTYLNAKSYIDIFLALKKEFEL